MQCGLFMAGTTSGVDFASKYARLMSIDRDLGMAGAFGGCEDAYVGTVLTVSGGGCGGVGVFAAGVVVSLPSSSSSLQKRFQSFAADSSPLLRVCVPAVLVLWQMLSRNAISPCMLLYLSKVCC
jgi:hypothetical protein